MNIENPSLSCFLLMDSLKYKIPTHNLKVLKTKTLFIITKKKTFVDPPRKRNGKCDHNEKLPDARESK